MHIPSAQALDIANHNFEARKVVHSDRIKRDVKENQRPFEEGINSVG